MTRRFSENYFNVSSKTKNEKKNKTEKEKKNKTKRNEKRSFIYRFYKRLTTQLLYVLSLYANFKYVLFSWVPDFKKCVAEYVVAFPNIKTDVTLVRSIS